MNPSSRQQPNAVPLRPPALAVFDPDIHAAYPLEIVARLAQVSRYRVALYCKHGLIVPVANPADSGWLFDAQAIRTVRQLEQFRELFGVNLDGTRLLLRLTRELEELRREVRFLREA